MIVLILDRPVTYLRRGASGPPCSLLTLPLGPGTLLGSLLAQLAANGRTLSQVMVLPTFGRYSPSHEKLILSSGRDVRIVPREGLPVAIGELEPLDDLSVIDPRYWLAAGNDVSQLLAHDDGYRGVSHVIAVGSQSDATREYVECDLHGHIKRVQRIYHGTSWPSVASRAICFSVLPARVAGDVSFRSLAELRSGLATRGVLSRDLPLHASVIDLGQESGLLAANEHYLSNHARGDAWPGLSSVGQQIWAGPNCKIHPSARLVGPIILQSGTTLDEGTTVIGPSVMGTGSRIGRGATVVQSVLAAGTEVSRGLTIRHRAVSGACRESLDDTAPASGLDLEEISLPTASAAATDTDGLLVSQQPVDEGRRVHLMLKRAADVVLSAIGLVALSPLLAIVAIAIKLESRGPVFFAHRREQKNGKEFSCWKFRTMVADAHQKQRELYKQNEVDGPQFKLTHDPRVTRVGYWLRATNVDELPQLFNVLVGHMSLVGPRPSPFRENQICVPWRRARLSVRPGITGLWQVCRDERTHGDFHQWIFYDITYVRHLSIWLDAKILIATLLTLGGRRSIPLSWVLPTHPAQNGRRRDVAVPGAALRA